MTLKKNSRQIRAIPNAAGKRVAVPTLSDVVGDWLQHFQGLARFKADQRLLKRIGPVVFGIELEKYLPDAYRPRMILYNLIDAGNKFVPVIDQLVKDNRGLQIFIPYAHHTRRYTEACELMARQARVGLLSRPSLEDIVDGVIAYVENDAIGDCFRSCQAVLQLSQLLESPGKREMYTRTGAELVRKYVPTGIFEQHSGAGKEEWIHDISLLDPEKINSLIMKCMKRHRLMDIPAF